MFRPLVLCCLLLNAMLVLAPFGTLHMHADAGHGVQLHGGHLHLDAHDDDGDEHHGDHAVDVYMAASDGGLFHKQTWLLEAVISNVLAVVCLTLPFVVLILRPPCDGYIPSNAGSRKQPPVRGPPAFAL